MRIPKYELSNGLDNHGLGMVTSALPSPQLGSLYRVAHQHGDGQRAHAAGDRRDGNGYFGNLGINVADQRGAVLGERSFALRVSGEELGELGTVGDLVPAHRGAARGRA